MGVWDSFWNGAQMGEHYGQMRRDREAFQDNGLEGVAQAAGRTGDMESYRATRRFQNEEQENAFNWFEKNAPYARNVLRYARSLQDPQQRSAFLQSQRQRFEGMGFQPDQIDQAITALSDPNTAEQAFSSYDAAFSQHEDPEWRLATVPTADGNGVEQRAVALGPNGEILRGEGSMPVPPGEIHSFGSGGLYRSNPNSETGYDIIREPRSVSVGGSSNGGYRVLSPEEAQAMGLPEGRTYQESPRGQITTVGGTSPMLGGADQRGRIALSFSNIVEAQDALARMEQEAVRRQGTHGSDTPLGQDWGARIAEAIPWDGGSIARQIGGTDYQQYEAASRMFEQSVMPIFSGSAVTESEAQRFVRANLPRMNDSRETLQTKARNRARIINAAAVIMGAEPPYPDAGTWTPSGGLVRQQQSAPAQGGATEFVRDANGRIVPRQ